MPDFRRGREAIKEANERKGGGNFQPFAPKHFWKDSGEKKYLLFLNPIEEIPQIDLIPMVPITRERQDGTEYTFYADFIARTDPAIGEEEDRLVEELNARARRSNLAVAVALEVETENVKGRTRPKGFSVATVEFDRRVRGDDGELTDETETITAPDIGFVAQSPLNFFNWLEAFDASEAPLTETPLKVERLGDDKNTTYAFTPYIDQPVDLTNLLDFVDGISYLDEEMDEIKEQIEDMNDDEAAALIASLMLEKRLEELADEDRYHELTDDVTEDLGWNPGGAKKKPRSKTKAKAAKPKPQRRSQRKAKEEPEPEADAPEEPEADAEPEVEEKPARRSQKKSGSDRDQKLADLRAKAAQRREKVAA
jgi:hypothetical protein